jgi:hypothetical protein
MPVPGMLKIVDLSYPPSDVVHQVVVTLRLSVAQVRSLRQRRGRFFASAGYSVGDSFGHVLSNQPSTTRELKLNPAPAALRADAMPPTTPVIAVSTLGLDPIDTGAILRGCSTVACPAGSRVAVNMVRYEARGAQGWLRYRPPGESSFTTPSRSVAVLYAGALLLESHASGGHRRLVSPRRLRAPREADGPDLPRLTRCSTYSRRCPSSEVRIGCGTEL